MRKFIETIPHGLQEYDTAGNYVTDRLGMQHFTISEMGNEDYEFMVSIHEQIEEHFTRRKGIPEETITAWDIGPGKDNDDPGSMPGAPYLNEHIFATSIERLICRELGYSWDAYDYAFNKLIYNKKDQGGMIDDNVK